MLKKTITYTDYNGNECTEDYWFHLNRVDVMDMEASADGSFSERLKKMVEEKDAPLMMKTFKELILKSVGVKSEDGKHFRKSKEYSDDFESSEAYSVLFSELCSDAEAAIAFISGILPLDANQRKELIDKVKVTGIPEST